MEPDLRGLERTDIIPLISTLCKGPLGIAQLPRFWWKNLLHQAGQLDAVYPPNSDGLDRWVVEILSLDMDRTQAHIWHNKPDYLHFEDWVQEHGTVDRACIERWNKSLLTRTHVAPNKIDETYADIGYAKEETTEVDAVLLNCLQDWQLYWQRYGQKGLNGSGTPFPPLISSIDRGPMGICQLPRTWLKTCLRAKGLLDSAYPDCADGSLDERCINTLQLDRDKTLSYLRDNTPTYLEFEAWMRQEAVIDTVAIMEFNERLLSRQHIPTKIEDIHRTIGRPNDGAWISGVLLNHLEDWKYAHTALTSKN